MAEKGSFYTADSYKDGDKIWARCELSFRTEFGGNSGTYTRMMTSSVGLRAEAGVLLEFPTQSSSL